MTEEIEGLGLFSESTKYIRTNQKPIANGAKDRWLKLKGKKVSAPVTLFINHEYKFQKFNLVESGEPAVVK